MSWHVRVLASTASAPGYRLAGLGVDEVANPADAGEQFARTAAETDVGIVLIEQSLLDAVPSATRHAVDRRALPIIVPVPAPNWAHQPSDAESYIVELLRRAIGYRVRLQ